MVKSVHPAGQDRYQDTNNGKTGAGCEQRTNREGGAAGGQRVVYLRLWELGHANTGWISCRAKSSRARYETVMAIEQWIEVGDCGCTVDLRVQHG